MTTTIKIQGNEIEAYTTKDGAWNNATSNGFWGAGNVLTNDGLFICISENHELFSFIMEELNWKYC